MDDKIISLDMDDKLSNINIAKQPNIIIYDYIMNRTYDSEYSMNIDQLFLQVTEKCNLACTYCYDCHNKFNTMTFETAKQAIDMVLGDPKYRSQCKFNLYSPFGLRLIGGEALLESKLCYQIIKYFEFALMKYNIDIDWHISIISNGILYDDEYTQKIIKEYGDRFKMTISIDGCKECHDKCRIFPNGSGSYDIVLNSALKLKEQLSEDDNTPCTITISRDNIKYVYESIISLIEKGFTRMHHLYVPDQEYTLEDAKLYYSELKKVSDYMIDNDLVDKVQVDKLFDHKDDYFSKTHLRNICGGCGDIICVGTDGTIYPCIRFVYSRPNDPLIIGHIDHGLGYTDNEKRGLDKMISDRVLAASYKCFNCPLSNSCTFCSAYNYDKYGTVNKRTTLTCNMQIVDQLVRAYGVNKIYRKYESYNHNYYYMTYHVLIPKEYAIPIIGEEEYNLIKYLSRE